MTELDPIPMPATVAEARAVQAAGAETFEQAVNRVRLEAEAQRESVEPMPPLAIFTESGKRLVLIGIARPDAAAVIQIDRAEYDGFELARMLGVDLDRPPAPTKPDIDQMRKDKHALRTR